ncbi:hypothetical protein ACFQQB_41255 [Nonomuraea rubra]|uniref:hypothetical protein n=1 Tax=Nonomuraea rubra TaxID=46180 RepID=UPI003616048B
MIIDGMATTALAWHLQGANRRARTLATLQASPSTGYGWRRWPAGARSTRWRNGWRSWPGSG